MGLTPSEKAFYAENGYILLDNIFTERELKACCDSYDALFQAKIDSNSDLEAEWKGNWKAGESRAKQSVIWIRSYLKYRTLLNISGFRSYPSIICNATRPSLPKCWSMISSWMRWRIVLGKRRKLRTLSCVNLTVKGHLFCPQVTKYPPSSHQGACEASLCGCGVPNASGLSLLPIPEGFLGRHFYSFG